MTTTLEPDVTTTQTEDGHGDTAVTYRITDDLVITAASEEEALRKYKRLVRAEALKAQQENEWCDGGTNERLLRLGLRERGSGIPVRVRVVAERTAYITLDADTPEEADELLASGEDPEVLELVTASVGRGWKAQVVEKASPREGEYRVGDVDDTVTAERQAAGGAYIPMCEMYSSTYGYCTRQPGHVEAGDRQHAIGNGQNIRYVWTERPRS